MKNILTDVEAHAIYDILVEVCRAPSQERDLFLATSRTEWGITEWRFQGALGFGGKFWNERKEWRVTCYPEDATAERQTILAQANEALVDLRGKSRA